MKICLEIGKLSNYETNHPYYLKDKFLNKMKKNSYYGRENENGFQLRDSDHDAAKYLLKKKKSWTKDIKDSFSSKIDEFFEKKRKKYPFDSKPPVSQEKENKNGKQEQKSDNNLIIIDWECPMCTYINNGMNKNTICEACETPAPLEAFFTEEQLEQTIAAQYGIIFSYLKFLIRNFSFR